MHRQMRRVTQVQVSYQLLNLLLLLSLSRSNSLVSFYKIYNIKCLQKCPVVLSVFSRERPKGIKVVQRPLVLFLILKSELSLLEFCPITEIYFFLRQSQCVVSFFLRYWCFG